MNVLQLEAFTSVMAGPSPRVVWKQITRAAAASISPTVPKVSGLLCVQFIYNFGGIAAPGLPTGFTNINQTAATATLPGVRAAYKYLDGSEAAALSSAAASATEMFAISYLIAGSVPLYAPQGNNASNASSSTINFATQNVAAGGSNRLVIGTGMWLTTQTLTGFSFPFDPSTLISQQGTGFAFGVESGIMGIGSASGYTATGTTAAAYRSITCVIKGR